MDQEEANLLIKISKEIEDSLATTVKINHAQVLYIVVADLLAKYKHAHIRGLDSEADMLKCVLLKYYLEDEELLLLMASPPKETK